MASDVVLYIIARNDMDSMNPGKLAAQAAHAANQFVATLHSSKSNNNSYERLYDEWVAGTNQGFGTTIVLAASDEKMRQVIYAATQAKYCCGITHDPTYPIMDGATLHLIPVDTCAFVFGQKNEFMAAVLGDLPLYP